MAAPNSAQISPSHSASTAPTIQPSMACGPPAALTISGMVMNGPTPIMSIMFSVVAPASPTPRMSSGCGPGLLWLMAHAQQVHIKANSAGHTERQLAEKGISRIDVVTLAELRHQQASLVRLLTGIVRRQQWSVLRFPLVHEVEATLLHPAIEIMQRNLVGIVQGRAVRIENSDRSLFDGHAIPTELCRVRSIVAGVEVAGRCVVLHQQRAAVLHVIQQTLIVLLHVVARVVGANAGNDGAEAAETAMLDVASRKKSYIEAELPQHGRDVVASAHDVADLEVGRDFDIDDTGPLQRGLIVEETAEVGARDQAVALAVIASA